MKKRRCAAAMMAAVMVMGTSMTAFAEEVVTTIPMKKVLTAGENTYAPETTFNFVVEQSDKSGTASDSEGKAMSYKPGPDGGLVGGTVSYSPKEDGLIPAKGKEKEIILTIHTEAFKNLDTGVYAYQVREDGKDPYPGISYDNKQYTILLYMGEDGTSVGEGAPKKLYCFGANVLKEDGTLGGKAKEIVFTNDYGKNADNDTIHDLTIKKEVTGNMGEKTRAFEFSITVTGGKEGEYYQAIQNGNEETPITFISGEPKKIYLKHDEKIQLFGLSDDDKIEVTEVGYKELNYEMEHKFTDSEKVKDVSEIEGGVGEMHVIKDGAEIVFTNNKHASPATGIAMTFGPYVLLVGLAGGLGALFLRKKEREDF